MTWREEDKELKERKRKERRSDDFEMRRSTIARGTIDTIPRGRRHPAAVCLSGVHLKERIENSHKQQPSSVPVPGKGPKCRQLEDQVRGGKPGSNWRMTWTPSSDFQC